MAGGKQSPRQKMINMMYLVLIALLALNVSKEILKSFFLMEVSFETSKKNLDAKNDAIMKTFESNMKDQAAKTQKWYDKAKQVRTIAKEFSDYIESTRKKLEELNGGKEARKEPEEGGSKDALTELTAPDQMEKHANYFVNQGNGKKMMDMINQTRTKLIDILKNDPDIQKLPDVKNKWKELEAASALRAEDPKEHGEGSKHTWVGMYLEHSPLAGVMTMLSKLQNDGKNLESDILNVLLSQINATDFKFDALVAKVIPTKGTVVATGESYEAEIILSAYNSKQNHDMYVGGSKIEVKDGVGIYKQSSTEGKHQMKGEIKVLQPDGSTKPYPFDMEYFGFKPSATISATKMNVLYVGLDNPVNISVPGFNPELVKVTMEGGGSLTGSKGNYVATVNAGIKEVNIKATVEGKSMGSVKFRVKNVPKPIASFGIKQGGTIKAVEVGTTSFITCGLGPEFAFEGMNYTVTKFNLTYIPKKGDAYFGNATGNALSPAMKGALAKARKGDMITVYNIEAMGPGKIGLVKIPTAIALTVE